MRVEGELLGEGAFSRVSKVGGYGGGGGRGSVRARLLAHICMCVRGSVRARLLAHGYVPALTPH